MVRVMFIFRLDQRTGVPAYRQLVDQVRSAVSLGYLRDGDQLPTVRDVSASLAINPNTVNKAYRELELAGIATPKQGIGTFISGVGASHDPKDYLRLRASLVRWLVAARAAGLSDDQVNALFSSVKTTFLDEQGVG